MSITIPTTGWARNSTLTSYYYCDISIAGLRATDITTESMAGKLRLRAKKAPTAAIKAQYRIINTVKN